MFDFVRGLFAAKSEKYLNPFAGRRLRYLIGASEDAIMQRLAFDVATVLPFDWEATILPPMPIGYCNMFWQEGAPNCAPYAKLEDIDNETAEEYGERVIDPRGPGFSKNLHWQFAKWKKLGVRYIELDNCDGYPIAAVFAALELAESYGFKVMAKNPGLFYPASVKYVSRCAGIISENGAGYPEMLHRIRKEAGDPDMPIWFVGTGTLGERWVEHLKRIIRGFTNMGVTLSRGAVDEYTSCEDIVVPRQ